MKTPSYVLAKFSWSSLHCLDKNQDPVQRWGAPPPPPTATPRPMQVKNDKSLNMKIPCSKIRTSLTTVSSKTIWGFKCIFPGGVLSPQLGIDTGTMHRRKDSMFRHSMKTTLFAVLNEKLPLFTALIIVTPLNNECIFPLRPENPTLFYKDCIFPILNDDSTAHCQALKKSTLSHLIFVQAWIASALPGCILH